MGAADERLLLLAAGLAAAAASLPHQLEIADPSSGSRRAVRPLTEVAKFNEVTDLPKVLDALATLGEAERRRDLGAR
jgi:hypothetical protein